MNGEPGIELIIKDAGSEISGVIVFYFQERGTDGKWHVKDKYEAAVLTPKVDGKSLVFEVAHHKTHDSPEYGPNVKFRMELISPDESVLRKPEDQADPGWKLTRVKEQGK